MFKGGFNFMMPFEAPLHFTAGVEKENNREEYWFIFKDSKLLVDKITLRPSQELAIPLLSKVYMGTYLGQNLFAVEAAASMLPPEGSSLAALRDLFGVGHDFLALAGRAAQLNHWERTSRFCGGCGAITVNRVGERAKECPSCHLLFYPKISPVVMALVQKGDEILLARGPHFPEPFYTALAGFVDPGETLEQCVRREVFEEVGLEVEDIRYFASQPWPFPHSLLIAFTCRWRCGEIKIDPVEIADAQWFKKGNLPLLPPRVSIARILIDAFTSDRL